MKIDGWSGFLIRPDISPANGLDESLLRDGQILAAKILSLTSLNEVLLEIAGRQVQARLEGHPLLEPGKTIFFKTGTDPQGRLVLQATGNGEIENTPALIFQPSSDGAAEARSGTMTEKAVIAALRKEGLSATRENVAQVTQLLRELGEKYQPAPSPKVLAFLLAQKWPVTPGNLAAAWVMQDKGLREMLWNWLKNSLPAPKLESWPGFISDTDAAVETVVKKLREASTERSNTSRLGEFLKELSKSGATEEKKINLFLRESRLGSSVMKEPGISGTKETVSRSISTSPTAQPEGTKTATTSQNQASYVKLNADTPVTTPQGMKPVMPFHSGSNHANPWVDEVNSSTSRLPVTGESLSVTSSVEGSEDNQPSLSKTETTPANIELNGDKSPIRVASGLPVDELEMILLRSKSPAPRSAQQPPNAGDEAEEVVHQKQPLPDAPEMSQSPRTSPGMKPGVSMGEENDLSRPEKTGKGSERQEPLQMKPETEPEAAIQRLGFLLEQNSSLQRVLLKADPSGSLFNLFPLLFLDSRGMVREGRVEWREETEEDGRGKSQRVERLRIVLPTEHLGDITVAVTIAPTGTRVDLKVGSEEIRQFMIQYMQELKKAIGENIKVGVVLARSEESTTLDTGVNVWM